jgi:hypothetical protein
MLASTYLLKRTLHEAMRWGQIEGSIRITRNAYKGKTRYHIVYYPPKYFLSVMAYKSGEIDGCDDLILNPDPEKLLEWLKTNLLQE